ncbi:MAG: PcfJ domain-containing protein [Bacteroidota bacterium]
METQKRERKSRVLAGLFGYLLLHLLACTGYFHISMYVLVLGLLGLIVRLINQADHNPKEETAPIEDAEALPFLSIVFHLKINSLKDKWVGKPQNFVDPGPACPDEDRLEAYLQHLFCKRKPKNIHPILKKEILTQRMGYYVDWFMLLAKGEPMTSLPKFPVSFSAEMEKEFNAISAIYSFKKAVRKAEILGLGGSMLLANLIIQKRAGRSLESPAFWRDVWLFFIENDVDEKEFIFLALDYIDAIKFGIDHRPYELQFDRSFLGIDPDLDIKQYEFDEFMVKAIDWQDVHWRKDPIPTTWKQFLSPGYIRILLQNKDKFVRPPFEWRDPGYKTKRHFRTRHLFDYLFKKHDKLKLPKVFYKELLGFYLLESAVAYIHLISGGKIRQLPNLPMPVTRKMESYIIRDKYGTSLPILLREAEVLTITENPALWDVVSKCRMCKDFQDVPFWRSVWTFVKLHNIHNRDFLALLINYIDAVKFGFDNRPNQKFYGPMPLKTHPNFQITGRKLENLIKEAHTWAELYCMRPEEAYPDWARKISPFSQKLGKEEIFISPLKNSNELKQEAMLMGHCVDSYIESCMAGEVSIWSMFTKFKGGQTAKSLTIELTERKEVVQAKGRFNASPTEDQQKWLLAWASENNIKVVAC